MDLYSGLPYWIIKNPLNQYYAQLEDKLYIEAAIIGSGITGALVAHELCEAGISCAIFDKRSLTTGSTAASTAQLQYEIDLQLQELIPVAGLQQAVTAYQASLQSISDIEVVFGRNRLDTDFRKVPSLYLASNTSDQVKLEREYELRMKYNLPVTFLSARELKAQYGIDKSAALKNEYAAQMDSYKATGALLDLQARKHGLKLYPYTEISGYQQSAKEYLLTTTGNQQIRCRYLVIAAGYEAGMFLPKNILKLVSTYVAVSEPVHEKELWSDRCLIWETHRPYCYLRTTDDNRMMIGGEDIPYKNSRLRDLLLKQKTQRLVKKFGELFPGKSFRPEMSWCGTFSATDDGLPYIGSYPGRKNMFFALGYGGNGITFSMIAAQIIRNMIKGTKDDRAGIFGFERLNKKPLH